MCEPCAGGALGLAFVDKSEPAPPERAHARISGSTVDRLGAPMHGKRRIDRDRDLAAQAVERKPPCEVFRCARLAIEQERAVLAPPDEKIEQRLALRRQQPGIDRKRSRD